MSQTTSPTQNIFKPVYLVELFSPSGELLEADVTGSFDNALSAAVSHAKSLQASHAVTGIDVQHHNDTPAEGIEGMALFTGECSDVMLVCVSRYELDNESTCERFKEFESLSPGTLKEFISSAISV